MKGATGVKLIFDLDDRGFNIKAWLPRNSPKQTRVIIRENGQTVREFNFPRHLIGNIVDHFHAIIDAELGIYGPDYVVAVWRDILRENARTEVI